MIQTVWSDDFILFDQYLANYYNENLPSSKNCQSLFNILPNNLKNHKNVARDLAIVAKFHQIWKQRPRLDQLYILNLNWNFSLKLTNWKAARYLYLLFMQNENDQKRPWLLCQNGQRAFWCWSNIDKWDPWNLVSIFAAITATL